MGVAGKLLKELRRVLAHINHPIGRYTKGINDSAQLVILRCAGENWQAQE